MQGRPVETVASMASSRMRTIVQDELDGTIPFPKFNFIIIMEMDEKKHVIYFVNVGFAVGGKKLHISQTPAKAAATAAGANNEKTKTRKPLQDLYRSKTCVNVGSTAKSVAQKTEKNHKRSGRKPLGDIGNIVKETKQALSKSVMSKYEPVRMQESMSPDSSIEEERCLHDHRECIKAQTQNMGFDYFLETVGLKKELPTPIVSTKLSMVPIPSKTPIRYHDDDEFVMAEAAIGSPPLQTPILPSPAWNMDLKNLEFSGFKLQETPAIKLEATTSP
ncbi:hypothetical protein Dimus_000232 [Dionaea muscipula]